MDNVVVMEIKYGKQKAKLYQPPTYTEWFYAHSWVWRQKNKALLYEPDSEIIKTYYRAIGNYGKQCLAIKTFMKNCNGHKE